MVGTATRIAKPAAAVRPARSRSVRASASAIKVPKLGMVTVPESIIKPGNTKASKDSRFTKVMDKLNKSSAKTKEHSSAKQKAGEAQAAALPPANEKLAGAQAQQVDTMQEAETKKPDSDSFLTLLKAEIEKVMPKNLGATENFMKGDDKNQLKGAVSGNVNQQKDDATAGIKSASNETPDPSKIEGKEVQPLPAEGAPATPPAVGAADAMPAPKTNDEISLQKGKDDANKSLTSASITPQQLQKANDPRFSAVLTAKSSVDKQADAAPQKYHTEEQKILNQAATKAVGDEKRGLLAMQGTKGKTGNDIQARQLAAKAKDELARKKVTDDIQAIFDKTKKAVDDKLNGLEQEVSTIFDKGLETALNAMTTYIDDTMHKWKLNRYILNPLGAALWLKDKLLDLPDETKAFFTDGRKRFTDALNGTIEQIAKLVETRLKEAKGLIVVGQREISDYVKRQPKELQGVAQAAEKEMNSRFEELQQSVDNKKNELAQNLAQRYKEANEKADAVQKEKQEENKGLLTVLKEKVGEVLKILTEFKDRIMGMLKQGKATVDLIVADPIGFLKNLLNAVKQGLNQFVNNIWTHLKAGFMKWLLGSLAEAGIELPKDFSLGSILKLVLSVLGLSYPRIRAKAVKLVGETTVKVLETVGDLVYTFVTGGAAALWEKIKEHLSNLKEMVLDEIQNWVVTTVIKAAVTKLATMFNPVGAIIQAIITIYNTVMFFIERINQILDFVQAIINSVYKIATGDIGSAANWVEQALANTIPIIIGFLARLLGLSGITDKIKGIIQKIQNKVDVAVDKVISKIVGGIGKLFGKGKEKKNGSGDPEHDAKVDAGLLAIDHEDEKVAKNGDLEKEDAEKVAATVKKEHPVFKSITVVEGEDSWDYDYVASPGNKKKGAKKRVHARVGVHKVDPPPGSKGGDSHHVPPKVLKRWIGEIYEIAGKATGNTALKQRGTKYKDDTVGLGLSAIWLSEEDHRTAHEPVVTPSTDIEAAKGEYKVTSSTNEAVATPRRNIIATAVHAQVVDQEESTARKRSGMNREIYEAKVKRLPSLFRAVFNYLLRTGIEWVKRVKIAGNWQGALQDKAKETWATIMDPKAED